MAFLLLEYSRKQTSDIVIYMTEYDYVLGYQFYYKYSVFLYELVLRILN